MSIPCEKREVEMIMESDWRFLFLWNDLNDIVFYRRTAPTVFYVIIFIKIISTILGSNDFLRTNAFLAAIHFLIWNQLLLWTIAPHIIKSKSENYAKRMMCCFCICLHIRLIITRLRNSFRSSRPGWKGIFSWLNICFFGGIWSLLYRRVM